MAFRYLLGVSDRASLQIVLSSVRSFVFGVPLKPFLSSRAFAVAFALRFYFGVRRVRRCVRVGRL